MSLLLASALAARVVTAADIDFQSPAIFISQDARAAVAAGTSQKLICLELPERSRKFRSACLTSGEWRKAVAYSESQERRRQSGGIVSGLLPQPFPSQLNPSYRSFEKP